MNIKSINELEQLNIKDYNKVIKVDLNKSDIIEIPEKIFMLSNLKILNFNNNSLSCISNKISNLKNLEELYLHKNKIHSLPEEIGDLKKLRKIIVSENNIKILPNNFYNLTNLEILNITSNKLEIISNDIYKLKNLEYLYLRLNKLRYIPKTINNIKEVIIYLNSYENINNLLPQCEFLQINYLKEPLLNLPITMKEIKLYLPVKVNIKLPFNCKLFIDDMIVE